MYYAAEAHCGQKRKMSGIPYILHPMEVCAIVGTMTGDEDVLVAALLHDTVEDCNADPKEIKEKFGARTAALVQSETEDKRSQRPESETWRERKEESLLMLEHTKDLDVKILWLADKLSNLRSFYREYQRIGEELWQHLHEKDPKKQGWYYRTVAKSVKELEKTAAYEEFCELVGRMFDKYDREEI